MTTDGYRALAGLIKSWADAHSHGRTVWALEGGYELEALADSVIACLGVLET